MDFKFCVLSAGRPGHLLACHACPKVIVSRLITGDDWGRRHLLLAWKKVTTGVDAIANDAKMPVTRSSENSNFLT